MIFLDNASHNNFLLKEIAKSPNSVSISTFGIYLGITYDGSDTSNWGHKYICECREVADALESIKNVNILVGVSDYTSCKGKIRCLDCEATYSKSMIRILNHVSFFPKFNWKMSRNIHLKCFLFDFDDHSSCVSGGRNFTGSNWCDLTFPLSEDDCNIVKDHYRHYWDNAVEIDSDAIGHFIELQGISEDGFLRAGER
jgi:hypothetical protein